MTSKAIAVLALLVACGGSPVNDTGTPDGSVPPPTPTLLAAGTYKATPASGAHSLTAPVGPAMETTLIADWSGAFSMVLPGYDFVRGGLTIDPDGKVRPATGMILAKQDGTVAPAVLVASSDGGAITGTIDGTKAFDLTLSTIQNQAFTVAQMAGSYLSTSTSTGAWVVISFNVNGVIAGSAYATEADAKAGNPAKAIGGYQGTVTHTGVPISCKDCVAPPNSFDIGFSYRETNAASSHPATYGFAYFTAASLVALTVNPYTGEQFTAVFAKQ